MRNKIFHFAVGAIASLTMMGTVAYTPSAVAMPGLENSKPDVTTSETPLACPISKTGETNYMLFTGAFSTIILGGLCLGVWNYRNRKRQRELTLQEQIQLLERIWKMTPQR